MSKLSDKFFYTYYYLLFRNVYAIETLSTSLQQSKTFSLPLIKRSNDYNIFKIASIENVKNELSLAKPYLWCQLSLI
jgi:hypothetical protein